MVLELDGSSSKSPECDYERLELTCGCNRKPVQRNQKWSDSTCVLSRSCSDITCVIQSPPFNVRLAVHLGNRQTKLTEVRDK